jgi:ankyrin repeat protein
MKLNVKSTEFFLFSLVVLLSIAANLPQEDLGGVISQQMLLIVLAAVVVVALFRYLRLLAFLCVLTLAIGANLPERLSESLGVSQLVMLIFLGIIILISALNKLLKLPTDRAQVVAPKVDTDEAHKAIMIAISIGNVKRLRWLISHNMEINFIDNGLSPALLAAEKGNSEIMQLLIYHGADLNVPNADGKTPYDVALAHGFNRTAEIIKFSLDNQAAMQAPPTLQVPESAPSTAST